MDFLYVDGFEDVYTQQQQQPTPEAHDSDNDGCLHCSSSQPPPRLSTSSFPNSSTPVLSSCFIPSPSSSIPASPETTASSSGFWTPILPPLSDPDLTSSQDINANIPNPTNHTQQHHQDHDNIDLMLQRLQQYPQVLPFSTSTITIPKEPILNFPSITPPPLTGLLQDLPITPPYTNPTILDPLNQFPLQSIISANTHEPLNAINFGCLNAFSGIGSNVGMFPPIAPMSGHTSFIPLALMNNNTPPPPTPKKRRSPKLKRTQTPRTKDRIFACEMVLDNDEVCGKTFYRLDHLRRHQLVHTRERPFICPLCPRSFARKDNFESHLRTHTEQALRDLTKPITTNSIISPPPIPKIIPDPNSVTARNTQSGTPQQGLSSQTLQYSLLSQNHDSLLKLPLQSPAST